MNHRRYPKKKQIVSCLFVAWLSLVGVVTEVYSSQHGRTDGEIQGAVLKRLEMDSRLDAHDLGVKVENGHAKIFGMVNSLKEKHIASGIASSIDGVTSLLNTLRIKPDLDEDRRIRLGIEQLIKTAGIEGPDSITINVENGVVTLKGLVSTRKDKNAIQKISENRPGVVKVKNLLAVTGFERRDMEIQKDVLFYLLWSPFFKEDEIHVEVKEGTIKLKGHIDFLAEKTILAEDLGNIHGVERVNVEDLTIEPENVPTQSS